MKYGKCLDSNQRCKGDPNEYEIKGNIVEVQTYDRLGNPTYKFTISIEDINLITNYVWTSKEKKQGVYIVNDKLGYLHHQILPVRTGITVDHIDRNSLNNTRDNLRYASQTLQNFNQRKKDTRFDVKGIDYHPKKNKGKGLYYAHIKISTKRFISYGMETYEEAVYARSLMEQLAPYKSVNENISQYLDKVSEESKKKILDWFINRFKNRVSTGKTGDIICGEADAIGYVYRQGNKTLISFKGGDNTIRGSRPLHLREKIFEVVTSDEEGNLKVDLSQIFPEK